MSLLPTGLTPSPIFGGSSAEERASRAEAQASALETLRATHPELFALRVSAEDPGVHCFRTKFGIDVTKEYLLEVLLRPHTKRICDSLLPGRKEAPQIFMFSIVKDVLNNLDIEVDDLAKIGVVSGGNSGWTEETYIHKQIGYLREALFNLHRLKTRKQKAAERAAIVEAERRREQQMAAIRVHGPEIEAARREEERRDREYKRILEEEKKAAERAARNAKLVAHGKIPPPEANLLGIHSEAAAEGENIDHMNAARKREIAANLEGLFSGGKRKQKSRKNRRARRSQQSRRCSRK